MVRLSKFSQFFWKHWKLIIIFFSAFSLFDYYFYLQEANLAEKNKEWNWPIHSTSIKKKRNRSSQSWGSKAKNLLNEKEIIEREQTSKKIIFFPNLLFGEKKHFQIDPVLCGGNCMTSYESNDWSTADAVIFHGGQKNNKIIPRRK